MKNILKLVLIFLPILIFIGCGVSGETVDNAKDTNTTPVTAPAELDLPTEGNKETLKDVIDMPESDPCEEGQYYRLKTKECLPLKTSSWGFQGFEIPGENIYNLEECTQEALEALVNNIPIEGGKIIMPECTISTKNGITLGDNVILEGAGAGKTIISSTEGSAIKLKGKNIIVRKFTVDGNGASLNGIEAFGLVRGEGNILIEFIEAKNFKADQGAGISFVTKNYLHNSKVTIRYCNTYNSLHGIAVKVHTNAMMLIYSNQSYKNKDYGIDMSTSYYIEVAGNYLHNNDHSGAKSPRGNRIIYHHNDINFNKKAGIGYQNYNYNYYSSITLEENDLSNNGGEAFGAWSARLGRLILKNNIVSGSMDANGYSILTDGIKKVDVYGDHGRIWDNNDSNITYY